MNGRIETVGDAPRKGVSTPSAFTLIELLIVVAIIGVLAAIAVPNFLSAQIRAKVSRSKADQRSVSVALQMYRMDRNVFPPEDAPYQVFRTPNNLTTPTAYLTTLPLDPFGSQEPEDPDYSLDVWNRFYYQNFSQTCDKFGHCGIDNSDVGNSQFGPWVLNGVGPDKTYSGVVQYDATNGVASQGDVIRSARSADRQRTLD